MIKVNAKHILRDVDMASYEKEVARVHSLIEKRDGPGGDYLGWAHYPETYDKEELERIISCAKKIRENYEVLLVCGIGGSYLGARAAIDALNGLKGNDKVEIIYFGQTLSPSYVKQVLDYIEHKKFAINVISKSGTTTETAVAFRLARDLLERKVGKEEAAKSIFATTDKEKGALLQLCKKYGYERFVLPADIGGRYSVFTAVGLLPMAVAGIDVKAFLHGMQIGLERYGVEKNNPAYEYGILRHELYKAGYPVEMLVTYEPSLVQLGEWWKQLFGESEGKEHTGLLPDAATFTTDLHSLGQFIQEGSPVLFETVLDIEHPACDVIVPHDVDDLDGLNYLEGKGLDYVNKKAHDGTLQAHEEVGKVPNILLSLDKLDAEGLGELMYFFMRACAMSCYLNDINPFNQPGVEVYKKNMFRLLGKPGYTK
ncbi:MAG: glucose-6-phosphate isomerase [Erysipelotrichaceae bacterium]|nr:glucose-6-phosphate isomerase [Erysipelotrichaceae bacterium]